MNCSHACEKEEPEPYKNIDLLIDDIEWKHAKAVELLLTGCCANAMEGAAKKKVLKWEGRFWSRKIYFLRDLNSYLVVIIRIHVLYFKKLTGPIKIFIR